MNLHNKYGKEELKKKLYEENFKRITLSFYRYIIIYPVEEQRIHLYKKFSELSILGRVYLAQEGINAQISVPEYNWNAFIHELNSIGLFKDMPLKIAVEDNKKSFYKLIVRIKNKIVADGLNDDTFDVTNVGTHLDAKEFNKAMEDPQTLVVDMRNHYESEIGHFENAICPDADTFKQALPMVAEMLKEKKEKKILLYCTGGIRCEKASAYLKHQGFKDVNQLHGGIIAYAQQLKEEGLPSRFRGKQFRI
jgi:UPF0176 protein